MSSGIIPGANGNAIVTANGHFAGGLLPDQVRFLDEKPWGPAFRQGGEAGSGNVYLPGEYVRGHLNVAFGFDGWSDEVIALDLLYKEAGDGKDGQSFRIGYGATVRLTVCTPGGRMFNHDGVGSWEGSGKALKKAYSLARKGAATDALKNAAFNLGAQFGLTVVRAGKGVSDTRKWHDLCVGTPPRPPRIYDFAMVNTDAHGAAAAAGSDDGDGETIGPDGTVYDSRSGVVVDDSAAERRAQAASDAATVAALRAQSRPDADTRQRDSVEANRTGITDSTGRGPSAGTIASTNTAANDTRHPGTVAGGAVSRAELVQKIRDVFRAVPADRRGVIFEATAREHHYVAPMAQIGRDETAGGASNAMLVDLYRAFLKAAPDDSDAAYGAGGPTGGAA